MCIIFISFYQIKECPLVILNNRDEICERPTTQLEEFKLSREQIEPLKDIGYNYSNYNPQDKDHYYSKDEDIRIYCGKDKIGGGTWLGVNNRGKFCGILNLYNKNFHESSSGSGKLSRGKIVQNYLSSKISPLDYLLLMERDRNQYHPFILIVGDIINSSKKYYCFLSHLLPPKEFYDSTLPISSYPSQLKVIERNSIFGISNYPLDWNTNKVSKGTVMLNDTLKSIFKERNLIKQNQDKMDDKPHSCTNDNDNDDDSHNNNCSSDTQKEYSSDNGHGHVKESFLFTNSEESKLLNILYNDDKDNLPPASTENINTSAIFVHPYHSIYSKKVHSTVSSSLITFTKSNSSNLMTFTQADNINNNTCTIKSIIN